MKVRAAAVLEHNFPFSLQPLLFVYCYFSLYYSLERKIPSILQALLIAEQSLDHKWLGVLVLNCAWVRVSVENILTGAHGTCSASLKILGAHQAESA